jgi:hypothetical protein
VAAKSRHHFEIHTRAADGGEHLSVHCLDVRAHKLRGQYRPLVLQRADPDTRERLLDFAGIPDRHRSKFLCLTLPTEDDGFIVCGVARVRAEPHDAKLTGDWYPAERRLLHELRANTGTDRLPRCP